MKIFEFGNSPTHTCKTCHQEILKPPPKRGSFSYWFFLLFFYFSFWIINVGIFGGIALSTFFETWGWADAPAYLITLSMAVFFAQYFVRRKHRQLMAMSEETYLANVRRAYPHEFKPPKVENMADATHPSYHWFRSIIEGRK